MMRRRTFVRAAALPALGLPLAPRAQVAHLNDAINKAGRQRMLSQRMGKAYLALAQNVESMLAQQVLDRSVALFDRQLVELRAFAPAGEVQGTYAALEGAWSEYKTALVGTSPARAAAPAVMGHAGRVLALAHKGTVQFESLLDKPVGRLVNVAGRQRMLSQRMAAFYLASVLPVDAAGARQEIARARAEFTAALELLRNAPEATPRIREQLQLGDAQWMLFDAALHRTGPSGSVRPLSDVFIASENLLQVMDRVTGLYAELKA